MRIQCTILDQISSVGEGLSLVKMRESCPTWKSPEGHVPGVTEPPNSFTARGPVTLTAILFPQPAV